MTIFVTTSTAAMVLAMLIFPVTKKLMMNVSMLAAIRQLTAFAKERAWWLIPLSQVTPSRFFPLPARLANGTESQRHRRPSLGSRI
jgi:hypothetical protein